MDADAGSFIAIPSTASIGGGSAIDFFGSRPAALAAALANAFACADDAGAHEGTHDAYTFRCVAGPRPGGGFVAVAASGGRSGRLSSGSISFAFAPTPESRRIAPREGPSHGGYPVWVYGSDLHAGSGGFGHGESPAMCLFVTTGADSTGVDAVVVSSVLAVCEAPAVPTQGAGSAGDTRALAVEFRDARAGMVHGRAGAQRVAVVARDVRGVAVRRRRRRGGADWPSGDARFRPPRTPWCAASVPSVRSPRTGNRPGR